MPAPAQQPASASGSLWDSIVRMLPQTSGIMKASDALGMAGGGQGVQTKAALQAQLDAMKAKGPVDGHYSKAWQDQVTALSQKIGDMK